MANKLEVAGSLSSSLRSAPSRSRLPSRRRSSRIPAPKSTCRGPPERRDSDHEQRREPGLDLYGGEKTLSEASVNDYDVLIVPGGSVGADNLRGAHCSCAAGERS